MRIKTIETRWNECKKYLHIIHFALSLSSEPLSEDEFKYVEKNLITVFFNPKITMKYSTSQASFCICLLMIMQMTTNVIRGQSGTQY